MHSVQNPSLRALRMRVNKLRKIPHVEQKSQEWYDLRKNKITASAIGSCLYKNEKTCGVVEEDNYYGIKKVLEPIGIIGAVIFW